MMGERGIVLFEPRVLVTARFEVAENGAFGHVDRWHRQRDLHQLQGKHDLAL